MTYLKPISTKSSAVAAYLSMQGFSYHLEDHHTEDGIVVFVFQYAEDALRELHKYISNEALVDPNEFVNKWYETKSRMHDYLNANSERTEGENVREPVL